MSPLERSLRSALVRVEEDKLTTAVEDGGADSDGVWGLLKRLQLSGTFTSFQKVKHFLLSSFCEYNAMPRQKKKLFSLMY